MILEMAELPVKPGQGAAFEEAFQVARTLVEATPGFDRLELRRCLENPANYLLLIYWESVEAHEVGFRGGPNYAEWKRMLHHFYEPFPTVLHFDETLEARQLDSDDHRVRTDPDQLRAFDFARIQQE